MNQLQESSCKKSINYYLLMEIFFTSQMNLLNSTRQIRLFANVFQYIQHIYYNQSTFMFFSCWSKIIKDSKMKKHASLPTILTKLISFLSYSKLDNKESRLKIFSLPFELPLWYLTTQLLYFKNFQCVLTIQQLMLLSLSQIQTIIILALIHSYKLGISRVKYLPPLPISQKSLRLKSLYHFFETKH